ncbi:MAG: hypothetical protein ABIZ05_14335 [Pseudonocardiaceae bacterium]
MLTVLVSGWSSFALSLLVLLGRPLRMLVMRVAFKAYRVPPKQQVKWALKESKRNGTLDLARGFWSRQSQRRPNGDVAPAKRFPAPSVVGADEDAA